MRVDQFLEEGVSEDDVDYWAQTASLHHANGDALDLAGKGGHIVGVRGRVVDRVNRGRLDPKDLFVWQAYNSGLKMFLANYLGLLHQSEVDLAEGFRKVADGHAAEVDVYHVCHTLAQQCDTDAEKLKLTADRYGEQRDEEPERLYRDLFDETRSGSFGLLRDPHDLYMMANFCDITWTMIGQAAQGAGDRELLETVSSLEGQTSTQIK